MIKNEYFILALMSGTSLDGLDLAYIHFEYQGDKLVYQIRKAETWPYTAQWEQRLKMAVFAQQDDLESLDRDYTALLAKSCVDFISRHHIEQLDAICSHGHTIQHQPHLGITLQIGNRPQLAELTQKTVVCDFRVQDVALGGQGAPLVPMGDRLLFGAYHCCLNLGGFANISFESANGNRQAFDVVAVNTVLNYLAQQLGSNYDAEGQLARSGCVDPTLLDILNSDPFFELPPPKSLGIEFVHQRVFPLINSSALPLVDWLATYVEHIAVQLAKILPSQAQNMLVTGGGAWNTYLVERLQAHRPQLAVHIPSTQLINFKEALIFGLLGVLRLQQKNNVLASVTGASRDHSSGFIYKPTDK